MYCIKKKGKTFETLGRVITFETKLYMYIGKVVKKGRGFTKEQRQNTTDELPDIIADINQTKIESR